MVGFSRQEYWSGLPFPSLGDLPNPGIELQSTALQADSFIIWTCKVHFQNTIGRNAREALLSTASGSINLYNLFEREKHCYGLNYVPPNLYALTLPPQCARIWRRPCREVIHVKWGHSSVQSLSRVWLCVTPWTEACQASLSITNSQSLLKLM